MGARANNPMVNPTPGGGSVPTTGGGGRRAGGSFTSPARNAALNVRWERLDRLSPRVRVLTGDVAPTEDETPPAAPTREERMRDRLLQKPILVFVHDDPDRCDGSCGGACQRMYDAEEQVFGQEKIQLAAHGFRMVRITPAAAAEEPLLEDATGDLPRVVLLDVARGTATVLDGSRLKASAVWSAMRKTADAFYDGRLETVVKQHMKLLAEHDKLGAEEYALTDRMAREDDDRKRDRLGEELDDLHDAQRELDRQIADLWDLGLRDL